MSSESYTPEVGHRIRLRHWGPGLWVDVKFIDDDIMFGRNHTGASVVWSIADLIWVKVEKPAPLPDVWCNAYPGHLSTSYPTRSAAEQRAAPDRLAVVHVWTDEKGDHAEIERCEP